MNPSDKIYIAGHHGLVGSALIRALRARGFTNLVTRSHAELDLCRQAAVETFFAAEKPDVVLFAAAKVGGIVANNTWRYDFIHQNLLMAANVIETSRVQGVKKLLFLGSSCIYPKFAPQPMPEDCLLTGVLEPTNEPYAIAKIAGVKLVENCNRQYGTEFISAMPTNLYGPGDNFDLTSSHVLPAMIRKFHEAKLAGNAPVTLWGSGTPRREFLHVDDMAEACVFILRQVKAGMFPGDLVNVGCGEDLSVAALATLVQDVVGHQGQIAWDQSKPDGTPRKLQDVTRLRTAGWTARIPLKEGMAATYRWFLSQQISQPTAHPIHSEP